MYLFVDKNSKKLAGSYGLSLLRTPEGDILAPEAMEMVRDEIVKQTGLPAEDLLPYEVLDVAQASALVHPSGELVVTVQDDVVISIAPAPVHPAVYLHLATSGGDGDTPPGIVNDGVASLQVTATLRAGPSPGSPVLPVNGTWRITIRDDDGVYYDMVLATLTNGQAQIAYKTEPGARRATCTVFQKDFTVVEMDGVTYRVLLVGAPVFKVYRVL
jgi:hypothetical protein